MANILNEGVVNTRYFKGNNEWTEEDVADHSKEMYYGQAGGLREDIADNMNAVAQQAKLIKKKRKHTYDWKTTNHSFIELYKDLTRLGIKNNKFFLRIYDKDLMGLDVYNPLLPLEMQLKIFMESIINPWYWLREVCRIPVDGKPIEPGGGSEFLADRNNIASWYCFLNGIDYYDSKSRQLGKTQNVVAQLNYAFHFGAMASTFLFFSKDFPLAKQNLYRLKCQRDMLPVWMQMRMSFKEDGKVDKGQDSVTILRNPITNNVIKVMPRATSGDAAIKMGRGETASFYWNDEYDFTPFNNEIMDAAAPAFKTASANAKENRSLYGRILSSTPGYLNTQYGKDAAKKIDKMLKWEDSFYDEPINKIISLLNNKKCNGWMYVEHTWKQLKKDLNWYQELCKLLDYDNDKILREIELQRIQGNELSPFSKQSLVYIAQHKKMPIEKLDLQKNLQPILIYEKINKKTTYVLAVDPSEGLALNNNAFVLIHPTTKMIVAEYKSPYISPPDFFRLIVRFMHERCPRSMVVIENNRGWELLNRFSESEYRYRVWYDPDKLMDNKTMTTDQYGAEKRAAMQKRSLGFNTNGKSKPLLFSIIERFMQEELDKVCTEYLVHDVTSVQRKPNGAIIMGAGDDDEGQGHGDVLMAYLIGLFVLYNAKNLEEFGIYPGMTDEPDTELTDQQKKQKILSAIGSFPDDLKQLFQDALKQTNPVEESRKWEAKIQSEMRRQDEQMGNRTDDYLTKDVYIDPSQQDDYWSSIDKTIMDGYGDNRQDESRVFDINNYV